MSTPYVSNQQRAVTQELLRSLEAASPEALAAALRTIPVCTDDSVLEDFDHFLAATGSGKLLRARLASTGGTPEVFLRLLTGASARSDDEAALFLLDSVPAGARIEVSGRMVRMLARGFAASQNPSAALLDRITDEAGPLEFVQHRHTSKTGIGSLLSEIATASIKSNSVQHLPLMVANGRLSEQLFSSRLDFWSHVATAATALSEQSMAELARLQDLVFASIPRHRLSSEQREKEDAASNSMIQAKIEALAAASNNEHATAATGTFVELLKMDLPLHLADQLLGNRSDWRMLAAMAPVQAPLGEHYARLARPLLRSGLNDIVMDAMVFGTDQWWNECQEQVRRAPSRLAAEMVQYVDFLEGELMSRLPPDTEITRVIDQMNASDPARASALADRLVHRVPQLAHITGSDADRQEWTDFMVDMISTCQPMTAAMFHSIALGMTTRPASEASRPPPRM